MTNRFALLNADLAQKNDQKISPLELHNKVAEHKMELMRLMGEKAWQGKVRNLIIEEIKLAVDGNIILPHYLPHCKSEQELYVFDGKYWRLLDQDQYFKMVKDCAARIGLPEEHLTNTTFMNALYHDVAHALHHPIENTIPEGQVWINLQNGTLKISSNGWVRLEPHRREDFFLYILPYAYDQQAICPLWDKFICEVLPDSQTRMVVQEFVGYCFTKQVKAEKMLVLKGNGSNGKSVLMAVLSDMFGKKNISTSELSDVTINDERRGLLENKLVNISSESDRELNSAILKQMISGEPVDIRKLYKGSRQMTDYGKFITSYNTLPKAEHTNAFFRRWLLIPFKQTFAGKQADKFLSQKIIASELPGVLNWAIQGLLHLIENEYNFTESDECNVELDKYRKSGDSVAMFLDDCTTVFNGTPTIGRVILEAYRAYCFTEEVKQLQKNTFFKVLEEEKHIKRSDPGHIPYFNLTLKPE